MEIFKLFVSEAKIGLGYNEKRDRKSVECLGHSNKKETPMIFTNNIHVSLTAVCLSLQDILTSQFFV